MKQLRPVSLALAALALCCWSAAALACDQNKSKSTATAVSASAKSADSYSCSPSAKTTAVTAGHTAKQAAAGHACTAEMAANCTPEMAAACAAHKGASAKSANYTKASRASAGCCMNKGAKASTAAITAGGHSGNGSDAVMLAGAGGSCASKSAKNTTAVSAGASCSDKHGAKATGHTAHANCDGCADFNDCDLALREMGAALQVVPLKNGVMFVYTSEPAKARSIQATMSQRKDQMAMFASAGAGNALCGDCKQLRGAAMSGKLAREVVNIEGGCLTLMTSSDPAVVARIHALAGVSTAGRAKI